MPADVCPATFALPQRRRSLVPGLSVGGAALLGALAAIEPKAAVAVVAAALLVALPFAAPVAHLLALVLITAVVPFGVQNAVAFGVATGARACWCPTSSWSAGSPAPSSSCSTGRSSGARAPCSC